MNNKSDRTVDQFRDDSEYTHIENELNEKDSSNKIKSENEIDESDASDDKLPSKSQVINNKSTDDYFLNKSIEWNLYTRLKLVHNPNCLTQFHAKEKNNYFKGCKWSNDGSCLVTCNNDKIIKIINLPLELSTIPINFDSSFDLRYDLQVKEGGLIYDYCFNPNLNSLDNLSCFFLATSHGSPIHMFDAYTGQLLNSYVAYTDTEEEMFAFSLTINQIKNQIYAGYKNEIRFYDLNRPGKDSNFLKTYYQKEGQQGLITCLAINPSNTDIFAAGSYSKQLALYSEQDMKQICVILGHEGGLTHMKFSYDGTKLFTGSRKENEIFSWDIRYLSRVLYTLKRSANTNQKIYFDTNFHTNYLVTGNVDGQISFFDLDQIETNENQIHSAFDPTFKFEAHQDCVNGVSLHPFYPLLASCSGQRKFKQLNDNDENRFFDRDLNFDNSLKLWWLTDVLQYNNTIVSTSDSYSCF